MGRAKPRTLIGLPVERGGWVPRWMRPAEVAAAQKRIFSRGQVWQSAANELPQCGGCRWFAALNGDWGICCNEKSVLDGRPVFEHAGCLVHSALPLTVVADRGGR